MNKSPTRLTEHSHMQMILCERGRDAISSQISPALGPEGTPAQDAQQQGTSSCMFFIFALGECKNEKRKT
jgi:hypothetical protein